MLFLRSTLLVLIGSLLAACGSSSHPAPSSPTLTVSASTPAPTTPTPSPSRTGPLLTGPGVKPGEKPPRIGPQETRHDVTGALNVAIFYYRAYDWSVATNDAFLIEQVSLPTCTACQRAIAHFTQLSNDGQVVTGGRLTIRSARIVTGKFRFRSDYVVEVRSHQGAQVLKSANEPPKNVAVAEDDDSLVFISWVRGSWRIVEVGAPS